MTYVLIGLLCLLWHWERLRQARQAKDAECVQRLTEAVKEAMRTKHLNQLKREGDLTE